MDDGGGILAVLADVGTTLAAFATLILVGYASKNLVALKRQIEVGQAAATAAAQSAVAAAESVRESARMRVDEQAPRVIPFMEEPQWPPFIDQHRSSMPYKNEPRLLKNIGQASLANSDPFYFNEQSSWFLWFRVRGALVNEGRGTARVRLDGEARFIAGRSALLPNNDEVPIPPLVGVENNQEYLLRPGDSAIFEWAYGHSLKEWADAHENSESPNINCAGFFTAAAFDWLNYGTVDHLYGMFQARPIEPVANRQGQWRLTEEKDSNLGLVVYPSVRTYKAESGSPPPPPWSEIFDKTDS
jgi:hypothetical protein